MTDQDRKEFLAIRKEAAKHIDPETAEVYWEFGDVSNPYGIYPLPPDGALCVGRVYFGRSPENDIWVCFYHLPEEIRSVLREKHCRQQLSFPAGLPVMPENPTEQGEL